MGWPERLVAVPLADPELEAVVRSVRADPFSLSPLVLAPGHEPAHLCATAWVLDPKRRMTLLVRHHSIGWSVPGGHLEPGERPAAGALRELREETGLAGRLLLPEPCFVHTTAVAGERPHRHWNLAYAVEAEPLSALAVERDPVAWFELDLLPSPAAADLAAGLATIASLMEAS